MPGGSGPSDLTIHDLREVGGALRQISWLVVPGDDFCSPGQHPPSHGTVTYHSGSHTGSLHPPGRSGAPPIRGAGLATICIHSGPYGGLHGAFFHGPRQVRGIGRRSPLLFFLKATLEKLPRILRSFLSPPSCYLYFYPPWAWLFRLFTYWLDARARGSRSRQARGVGVKLNLR